MFVWGADTSIYTLRSPIQDLLHLKKLSLRTSLVAKSELYALLSQLADRNMLESLRFRPYKIEDELENEIDYEDEWDIIDILGRFTKLKSLHKVEISFSFIEFGDEID